MIIRNRDDSIVMITQHDHAYLSGKFAAAWKNDYFLGKSLRKSVEYAVTEHDRSWIPVDAYPYLNDQTNLPYSFLDYPLIQRLIFYKQGIDEVAKIDAYAGLLCSAHYVRFASRSSTKEAKEFVQRERVRQENVKARFGPFNEAILKFHVQLLGFCDHLSLYICLNERGTSQEKIHYFFENGLPIPSTFTFLQGEQIDIGWQDQKTIIMSKLPFTDPLTVNLNKRIVAKSLIKDIGIAAAYHETPTTKIPIQLTELIS